MNKQRSMHLHSNGYLGEFGYLWSPSGSLVVEPNPAARARCAKHSPSKFSLPAYTIFKLVPWLQH